MTMNTALPNSWSAHLRTGLLLVCGLFGILRSSHGEALSLKLGDDVTLELIHVPAGKFQQGSPVSEPKRGTDESQRSVTLARDFFLGKHSVTRAQFERFVAETGYRTEAERGTSGGFGWDGTSLRQAKQFHWRNPGFTQMPDHPVTLVTYSDALKFCEWLRNKTNRSFQLPTEAEWEYACRAGSTTAWHNGDVEAQAGVIAWFKPRALFTTHPVSSLQPNAWGFHIGGNVYEWCRDWYAPYPEGPVSDPLQTNPNLSDKPRRVLRGGSWLREVQHTRSAARYRNDPASRNPDNGFRVMTYENPLVSSTTTPPVEMADAPARPAQARSPLQTTPPVDQPVPLPMRRTVGFGLALFPLMIMVTLGFFFLLILSKLLKSVFQVGPPALPAPPSQPVSTSFSSIVAKDGFWMHADPSLVGTTIGYAFWLHNQRQQGQAVYQPDDQGRQFIYTGSSPDQVDILGVVNSEVALEATDVEDDPGGQLVPPLVVPDNSRFPSAY
jgi:formylglycine-generating enzyme required for sulfatase activity